MLLLRAYVVTQSLASVSVRVGNVYVFKGVHSLIIQGTAFIFGLQLP